MGRLAFLAIIAAALAGACFQQLDNGAATGGERDGGNAACGAQQIVGAGGACLPFDASTPGIELADGGTSADPCARTVERSLAIRRTYCASCHAPPGKEGSFDEVLDDAKLVTAVAHAAVDGSAPTRLVVPGDPRSSLLYQRVVATGAAQMPPSPSAVPTVAEVSVLRAWIECMGDAGAVRPPGPPIDSAAVLAKIAGQAYTKAPAFKQASVAFASAVTANATITEWVSAESADAFARISPDATGSKVTLPEGAIIVRAVADATGKVTKLTLLAKGPAGYNPALGDWWFGVTDPNGVPLSDDAGVQTGQLTACYSCHLARDDDDFLFGVAAASKAK